MQGADIITTLDAELQIFAEQLMVGKKGGLVAMDPNTGGILAMVSSPDFELERLAGRLDTDYWQQINADSLTPMYNRAISNRQPPGSTFKPLMGIVGMEMGIVTPETEIYNSGQYFRGRAYGDLADPGDYDLKKAITHSSNTYFFSIMDQIASNNRADGWRGLSRYYNLNPESVTGLDHDLAYRGLESGSIQVMDLYSTDAEIEYYDLRVLKDDHKFFPDYQAVWVYSLDLRERHPEVISTLKKLEGRISEDEMSAMNALVKLDREPAGRVAADFLNRELSIQQEISSDGFWSRLWTHTKGHLYLTGISLSLAILVAIPLGILAVKISVLESAVLGLTGILQTIPSLALLVFMIPLFGIGAVPAMAALFIYSLLPIVRNTHSGLQQIPRAIQDSAFSLGLPQKVILQKIELPLAMPTILAGIKTSAVINVGTATLGALIGAGGYGQPILTGIRLDSTSLILEGAIPAALLALLVQYAFDLIEKRYTVAK